MIAIILSMILQFNIRIYEPIDLTDEILTNRTVDELIIEHDTGVVLNDLGDGEVTNPFDSNYTYISYCNLMEYANPGDTVTTYCIYNPYTQYEDDIKFRIDIVNGRIFLN